MSDLTECNYHTLLRMKKKAANRGVRVDTRVIEEGPQKGWVEAKYSDEEKPSAFFMEVTDHCVC